MRSSIKETLPYATQLVTLSAGGWTWGWRCRMHTKAQHCLCAAQPLSVYCRSGAYEHTQSNIRFQLYRVGLFQLTINMWRFPRDLSNVVDTILVNLLFNVPESDRGCTMPSDKTWSTLWCEATYGGQIVAKGIEMRDRVERRGSTEHSVSSLHLPLPLHCCIFHSKNLRI